MPRLNPVNIGIATALAVGTGGSYEGSLRGMNNNTALGAVAAGAIGISAFSLMLGIPVRTGQNILFDVFQGTRNGTFGMLGWYLARRLM